LQQPKLQVQPQRLHQQQPLLNGKEKEPWYTKMIWNEGENSCCYRL
jgi:hypothetical protein